MLGFNSRPVLGLGYCLLSITLLASVLQADSIPVGAPTNPNGGTVDLTVTTPNGTVLTFNVPIPAVQPGPRHSATTAPQKAEAIFNALSGRKDPSGKPLIPGLGYVGNHTVTAPGSTIKVTGDTTAEPQILVADLGLSLHSSPAYATLGFDGPLSPIGTDGAPSRFTASFGVDGSAFSSATVTYNQLTSRTDDGLATALYDALLAGLSPSLRPDLSVDLSTDAITFDFPVGSGEYFVQTSNTSAGTSQFMSVVSSPVPEPVTFLSLGTGLVLIGACRRIRRRSRAASPAIAASSRDRNQ